MAGPGTEDRVRSVAIVGAGVEAWLTALALARALDPARCAITVAEPQDAWRGGRFLTAPPSLVRLHQRLGLDEAALVRSGAASFSLGVRWEGWRTADSAWFEPWGEAGAPLGPVRFHQIWLKLQREGGAGPLADYSLGALAAAAGRFARPSPDPRSVLSTLAYGLNLDLDRYVEGLRRLATGLGVVARAAPAVSAETSGERLSAAVLADGERLEADLFIDASGPAGALIGALGEAFEPWAEPEPLDRRVEVLRPDPTAPLPLGRVAALPRGWLRHTPLQGGEGLTLACRSGAEDPVEALAAVAGPAARDAVVFDLRTGRRRDVWIGNCLAVGSAAAELAAPDGAGVSRLVEDIERLLDLFPRRTPAPAAAREYARLFDAALAADRDFMLARLRLNGRRGEPQWDRWREAPVSETLARRLRLFESRGRVARFDPDPTPESDWVWLFLGAGVDPRRHDPLADALAPEALRARVAQIGRVMREAAAALPPHAAALARPERAG